MYQTIHLILNNTVLLTIIKENFYFIGTALEKQQKQLQSSRP